MSISSGMDEKTKSTQSGTKPRSKRAETAARVQAEIAEDAKNLQATVHEATKRKRGQPTKFTPELWERILEAVATYQDLIEICGADDMPSVATVYRWMKANPELKEDMRGAWEMFSMVGQSVNTNILSGGRLSSGDVRRDIELANNNRWFMGKTNRRDFGDKTLVQVETVEPFVLEGWMLPGVIEGTTSETPKDAQDDSQDDLPHT